METMDFQSQTRPSAPMFEYDPNRVLDLFPDIANYRNAYHRRDYVESILLEKIRDRSLIVTDLFQQSADALNNVAYVILGITVEEGVMRSGAPVPMEIADYRVSMRSLVDLSGERKPLSYKAGMKRVGDRYFGKNKHRQPVYVDNMVYPCGRDATEGTTTLPHAFLLLQQSGKYCYRAHGERQQVKHWRCEEVINPPSEDTAKTGRRKRLAVEA